jgi:uncharacterized coiled-coil DUF342 family protein
MQFQTTHKKEERGLMSEQPKNCKELGKHHKWGPIQNEGISKIRICEKCPQRKNLTTSRADRLVGVIYGLQTVMDNIQEILDKFEEFKDEFDELDEEQQDRGKQQVVDDIDTVLFEEATSELSSLAEEMRSWADNMEGAGTGLENTDKYQRVSDAADILENEQSELDGIGFSDFDELEDTKGTIENSIAELESVEFPGMFG